MEVSLTSNQDQFNNRIYYLTILADGTLTYHWATELGDPWNEVVTGVVDAEKGLDSHWNYLYPSGRAIVVSYINTASEVCVAMRSTVWTVVIIEPNAIDETSIAAYNDNIIVVFEYNETDGPAIRYEISYDGGNVWLYGFVADPDPGEGYWSPAVAGRKNSGGKFCVFYQEEVGEPDPVWVRCRSYTTPDWNWPPYSMNEMDVTTGSELDAEWQPPILAGETQAHGVVWFSSPYDPYYDRCDVPTGPLDSDTYGVSERYGAVVNLTLDAGNVNAGRTYLVLGSLLGTAGIPLPGGMTVVPLTWDIFTNFIIANLGPPIFPNFLGTLSVTGTATAQFDSLGPLIPGMAGNFFYFAFLLLGPPWDYASNYVQIRIYP
jgi:hypothetical protein